MRRDITPVGEQEQVSPFMGTGCPVHGIDEFLKGVLITNPSSYGAQDYQRHIANQKVYLDTVSS